MENIKKFFSFQSIKENMFFYFLFSFILVLMPFTPFKIFLVWSPIAFIISFVIWLLCSLLDIVNNGKKLYFNIGGFITTMSFGYAVFTVTFTCLH